MIVLILIQVYDISYRFAWTVSDLQVMMNFKVKEEKKNSSAIYYRFYLHILLICETLD